MLLKFNLLMTHIPTQVLTFILSVFFDSTTASSLSMQFRLADAPLQLVTAGVRVSPLGVCWCLGAGCSVAGRRSGGLVPVPLGCVAGQPLDRRTVDAAVETLKQTQLVRPAGRGWTERV